MIKRIPKNKQRKKEVRALSCEQESYTVRYRQLGNKSLHVGLHQPEEPLGGSSLYGTGQGRQPQDLGAQKDTRAAISHCDTRSGPLLARRQGSTASSTVCLSNLKSLF